MATSFKEKMIARRRANMKRFSSGNKATQSTDKSSKAKPLPGTIRYFGSTKTGTLGTMRVPGKKPVAKTHGQEAKQTQKSGWSINRGQGPKAMQRIVEKPSPVQPAKKVVSTPPTSAKSAKSGVTKAAKPVKLRFGKKAAGKVSQNVTSTAAPATQARADKTAPSATTKAVSGKTATGGDLGKGRDFTKGVVTTGITTSLGAAALGAVRSRRAMSSPKQGVAKKGPVVGGLAIRQKGAIAPTGQKITVTPPEPKVSADDAKLLAFKRARDVRDARKAKAGKPQAVNRPASAVPDSATQKAAAQAPPTTESKAITQQKFEVKGNKQKAKPSVRYLTEKPRPPKQPAKSLGDDAKNKGTESVATAKTNPTEGKKKPAVRYIQEKPRDVKPEKASSKPVASAAKPKAITKTVTPDTAKPKKSAGADTGPNRAKLQAEVDKLRKQNESMKAMRQTVARMQPAENVGERAKTPKASKVVTQQTAPETPKPTSGKTGRIDLSPPPDAKPGKARKTTPLPLAAKAAPTEASLGAAQVAKEKSQAVLEAKAQATETAKRVAKRKDPIAAEKAAKMARAEQENKRRAAARAKGTKTPMEKSFEEIDAEMRAKSKAATAAVEASGADAESRALTRGEKKARARTEQVTPIDKQFKKTAKPAARPAKVIDPGGEIMTTQREEMLKSRKAQIEKFMRKEGATKVGKYDLETKTAETKRMSGSAVKSALSRARKAGKVGLGVGASIGILGMATEPARAAATAPKGRRLKAAGQAGATSAVTAGAIAGTLGAAKKVGLGGLARVVGRFALPAAIAATAYDVGKAVVEGKKAFEAGAEAKREAAGSKAKYGTIEAAAKTRKARRKAKK